MTRRAALNEHVLKVVASGGLSLTLMMAQSVALSAVAAPESSSTIERGAFTPLKRSNQGDAGSRNLKADQKVEQEQDRKPDQDQKQDQTQGQIGKSEKFTPLKRDGAAQESKSEEGKPSGYNYSSSQIDNAEKGAYDASAGDSSKFIQDADEEKTAGGKGAVDEELAEHARREKAAEMAAQALHNEALDHYELARAYLGQWNFEMAERELKASLMCEPGIKAAHRDYVLVSLMMCNPFKALAEFMMVVGIGEPVPYSEKQKTAIRDDNAKAHYEKGIALARDSKWNDAITEYQWAQTYHPNDARISRSLAFAYGSAGEFEQAEKEYATSFAQDPGDAFTHADLAFLLEKSGDKQKALAQMQEAVALQPKVAALHVDLGWLAEAKGDLDLASGEFRQAVDLAPRHASLWTHLGKLLARKGDSDGAREAYQKALSLDPQQADAAQGLESLSPAAPLSDSTKKAS